MRRLTVLLFSVTAPFFALRAESEEKIRLIVRGDDLGMTQSALVHARPEDAFPSPGAGKHRAAELQTLLSNLVKTAILRKGVVLTNYGELRREPKQ